MSRFDLHGAPERAAEAEASRHPDNGINIVYGANRTKSHGDQEPKKSRPRRIIDAIKRTPMEQVITIGAGALFVGGVVVAVSANSENDQPSKKPELPTVPACEYMAAEGDTLWDLSQKALLDVDELVERNGSPTLMAGGEIVLDSGQCDSFLNAGLSVQPFEG